MLLFSSVSHAQETVQETSQATGVRIAVFEEDDSYFDIIEEACSAINCEDSDKYISFFASSTKKRKKQAKIFFMSNEVNVSILDKKAIDTEDDFVELMVKYRTTINESSSIVVCLIKMKKIDSDWKIIKESVISNKQESRCASGRCRAVNAPPKPDCANGRCSLD